MNQLILEQQLLLHEGLRLKPYADSVGVLTIGIGRNLAKGISKTEAAHLLRNDITECVGSLDEHVPWWSHLAEARQHVLLDMCFNLGITRLLKFEKTIGLVQGGDYRAAARAMLQSKWATQVGKRAQRLATMMETGEFPAEILGAEGVA